MNHQKFLKRLRKELPLWIEQGWVKPEAEQSILAHISSQHSGSHFLAHALAVLGVLLLGSGVISFFAANWEEMSKLLKLMVLLGSMWAAYLVSAYLIQNNNMTRTGQAVLLLGMLLFGANIMLIAQIYHIDSHYPNGVLLWALGGLLAAYLLNSQVSLVAALALATLWTGMESLDFSRNIHGWYLLFWSAALPIIYRRNWYVAGHVALLGLLLWSLFTYEPVEALWPRSYALYLTQLYFLFYLALFLAGMLMATSTKTQDFAQPVQRYAAFASLCSFYVLTYPHMQTGMRWEWSEKTRQIADGGWIAVTGLALVIVAGLALWHRQRTLSEQRPRFLIWGQGLIVAVILLILSNLFLSGKAGGATALVFNVLFFAGIVWLVYAGIHNNDRFMVNMAFMFFAITLLSRYFDTFWSLLNRSFFFMAGGTLLIVGGYWLEKKRRQLTGQIKQQRMTEQQS